MDGNADRGFDDGIHLGKAQREAFLFLEIKKKIIQGIPHTILGIDIVPPADDSEIPDDCFHRAGRTGEDFLRRVVFLRSTTSGRGSIFPDERHMPVGSRARHLFLEDSEQGARQIARFQDLGDIRAAPPTNGLHDFCHLSEILLLADPGRPIIVDRLLKQRGKFAVEKGVFLHFFRDRLLRAVGDGVGLGPHGLGLFHLLFECLALENIDRIHHLDDLVRLHVGVQHLLDLLLVITVIDSLGVADFHAGAQLLEKGGIVLVSVCLFLRCGIHPVDAGRREL